MRQIIYKFASNVLIQQKKLSLTIIKHTTLILHIKKYVLETAIESTTFSSCKVGWSVGRSVGHIHISPDYTQLITNIIQITVRISVILVTIVTYTWDCLIHCGIIKNLCDDLHFQSTEIIPLIVYLWLRIMAVLNTHVYNND